MILKGLNNRLLFYCMMFYCRGLQNVALLVTINHHISQT